uniref:Uncharacterized protein n=1 Tax=Anguilla anguilla TaxID=7936 RepID=A0A0E9VPT9_ANGAN
MLGHADRVRFKELYKTHT